MNDLFEQLRQKDVFDIDEVAYAILETNGALSVLRNGAVRTPSYADLGIRPPKAGLTEMLVMDGKIHERALQTAGKSEEWLRNRLKRMGFQKPDQVLFASLNADGSLHVQGKARSGARVCREKANGGTL